jgi:hypothetical protein
MEKKGTLLQYIPTAVKKPVGNFTTTIQDTLEIITDTLIPSIVVEDSQIQIEDAVFTLGKNITVEELKIALWRMNLIKNQDMIT